MNCDIVLAGVGGQGILSIATILGAAALKEGLYLKQAEVHGMSQRGGDVQSNLRISDKPIASDLIPLGKADLIVSLEPMEALRYLPYLSDNGWLITNTASFINIPNYPTVEDITSQLCLLPKVVAFDMDLAAKDLGSPRSSNMILLGAASAHIDMMPEKIVDGIRQVFKTKGDKIVETNIAAFNLGRDLAIKMS